MREKRKGNYKGRVKGARDKARRLVSERSLSNLRRESLPPGVESAAVRVTCSAAVLRWWRDLGSQERGRIISRARAEGWTGKAAEGDEGDEDTDNWDYAE